MINKVQSPESVGMSSQRLGRIGTAMQRYVDDGVVRGISTMVMRKGKVVHAEQFGHRDAEAGLKVTPETIFRIYSMTKPIVSTALMLLHEASAFQLEDPVAKYLPLFGATQVLSSDGTLVPQARPMNVCDLMTHTSGLTYDFMEDTPVGQLYREARIMNDATRTLEATIYALAGVGHTQWREHALGHQLRRATQRARSSICNVRLARSYRPRPHRHQTSRGGTQRLQ